MLKVANSVIDASRITGVLPVANGGTGITSFGSGIATFLGTPSSANLASAVTDETGSGALVFGTSPTVGGNWTISGSYAVSQSNGWYVTNGQNQSGGTGYGVSLRLTSDSGGNYDSRIVNVAGGTSYNSLIFSSADIKLSGSLIFNTAATGITGSSAFSVSIANAGTGTLLDLSVAMPAGSTGIVNVSGASAGKATILAQRDSGGYYSVTELGTQPGGTYITAITLSGTNLRITNATGATQTFSGHIIIMT